MYRVWHEAKKNKFIQIIWWVTWADYTKLPRHCAPCSFVQGSLDRLQFMKNITNLVTGYGDISRALKWERRKDSIAFHLKWFISFVTDQVHLKLIYGCWILSVDACLDQHHPPKPTRQFSYLKICFFWYQINNSDKGQIDSPR